METLGKFATEEPCPWSQEGLVFAGGWLARLQ
jgi:hypothetical protein